MKPCHCDSLPCEGIGNIACDRQQRDFLIRNIDYIEAWPDDARRVRFAFKDGRKGPWFSRGWKNLTYVHVAPR